MDLILFNGKIETMDSLNPRVEAVAVKNGNFIKVGSNDEVISLKASHTKVIDLKGSMVVPGFIDGHMHLSMFGANQLECNLVGTKSIEELIERMRNYIEINNVKPGQWVTGKGWNQDYFHIKNLPAKYDLDKISTIHNICLTRACYHMCVVNSMALTTAGIDRNNIQIDAGVFDKDDKGEPTGICRESALKHIYSKLPLYGVEDIKNMIISASSYAISKGITSVQTDDFMLPGVEYEQVIKAYNELNEGKKLSVRVYEQCLLPTIVKLKGFLDKGYRTGQGDEFFKIGPLKLLGDGNLGTRTAYLSEPYADDPTNKGIPMYTQDKLDEIIAAAHNSDMQVAIHCIGDKTLDMVLDAIEKAVKENPRKDPRHTIIHCQIADDRLLNRLLELKVIACVQPIFLNYDLHMAEPRLGKERLKNSYNWKSMLGKGVNVAFGSDCPVELPDVLPGIYSSVTRKDLNGYPQEGWMPEQRISVCQALYGYTLGSAYESFEENIKGSIEIGKLADMVILSKDLYEIEPEKIKDVEVLMTFVNGKLVYEK